MKALYFGSAARLLSLVHLRKTSERSLKRRMARVHCSCHRPCSHPFPLVHGLMQPLLPPLHGSGRSYGPAPRTAAQPDIATQSLKETAWFACSFVSTSSYDECSDDEGPMTNA